MHPRHILTAGDLRQMDMDICSSMDGCLLLTSSASKEPNFDFSGEYVDCSFLGGGTGIEGSKVAYVVMHALEMAYVIRVNINLDGKCLCVTRAHKRKVGFPV
eukprot:Gb_20094 [translate_table: standard]